MTMLDYAFKVKVKGCVDPKGIDMSLHSKVQNHALFLQSPKFGPSLFVAKAQEV
jgi:hypothetical protein